MPYVVDGYPTARPTLLLDFVRSRRLDPRVTFTRGSSATRVNDDGLIELVGNNVPRFDYDPVTLACRGLLIEEQRTNLLTYSEQFDNAAWTKNGSTVAANGATAPDGTLTADKIVENTANSTHRIEQSVSVTASAVYTTSVFAKAGERTILLIKNSESGGGTNSGAYFDLSSGTATSTETGVTASCVSAGSGWYRCAVTWTANSTASNVARFYLVQSGTTFSYTGDGTSGIYIWGAQLEAGAFPTSYVPSTETFTSRAGQGSFYGSDGLVQYSGTNLLTRSQEFDDAAWTKVDAAVSVSANSIAAPDGTTTADTVTSSGAGVADTRLRQIVTVANDSATYTASVYIKRVASEAESRLDLRFTGGTALNYAVWLNWSSLALTTVSGANAATSTSVVALANGWYRISVTGPNNSSGNTNGQITFYPVTTGSGTATNIAGACYFWGAQLEAGLKPGTYRPTTTAAITANPARLNYNPTNLSVAPKLLLEEQRTNLLKRSEDFGNADASWGVIRVQTFSAGSVADATTAPDGTTTADFIAETASTGTHDLFQVYAGFTSGTSYTLSCFFKANQRGHAYLGFQSISFTANQTVLFTLSGAGSASVVTGTPTAAITAVGNGWYRCSITATATATAQSSVLVSIGDGVAQSYAGDGTSGIYIWGAQLEAGYPTSYIPTTTASVVRSADVSSSAATVRSADVATMTGTNFSSWYNQTEGSFLVDSSTYLVPQASTRQTLYIDNSGGGYISIKNARPSALTGFTVLNNADSVTADISSGAAVSNVANRISAAYKVNDFAISCNGAAATTDSAGDLPTAMDKLGIGYDFGATYQNGHIRRIYYFNTRLSNAILQTISNI